MNTILQNEYALKSKEVVNIVAIGDFHIGSSAFDKNFFKQMLKQVKDLDRKRIYLMGDLLETASKGVGDSVFNQECSVDEQKEYLINNIEQFKEDIVCYCMGNHEYRLNKEFGYNVVKDICRELNINSCNQHLDTFKINDFDFSVYVRHGKGSSQRKHLAMGKMEKEMQDIWADLYMQGHTHRLLGWDQLKRFPNGYKRVYYAHTGSFLKYEGYADQMYLQKEVPSYQIISVNKNRVVKFNKYYSTNDEEWLL